MTRELEASLEAFVPRDWVDAKLYPASTCDMPAVGALYASARKALGR